MNQGVGQHDIDDRLRTLFGEDARSEGPLADSGAGLRLTGVDLCPQLSPEQVTFLLDALGQYRILSIAGQDLATFSLALFERFANHWGAPVPHPNNFLRGGKPAQSDGDSDGPFELIPFQRRRAAAVNTAFPDQLQCLPHESPVSRAAAGKSWVQGPDADACQVGPYYQGSDDELMRLRMRLPLNGETAFADTAAAFAALPKTEQSELERVRLQRRLNEPDEGWLAPLVRTNPRSGIKSLHSPIWASRPRVRPPVAVKGMSMEASRVFLDRLEAHVLQPQFRYDHPHAPGDMTLWDNYMTLHNSPPIKTNTNSIDDARLLYRLSCKGEPALSLPRRDAPEWLEAHIAGGYTTPSAILEIA